MTRITLQFDSYKDMIAFCNEISSNNQNKLKKTTKFKNLDDLNTNIVNFCDHLESELQQEAQPVHPISKYIDHDELRDPKLSGMGSKEKAIIRLFCRSQAFSYQMLRQRMPQKTDGGSYIEYKRVVAKMVRKNLLVQLPFDHYTVNPLIIKANPTWLDTNKGK